MAGLAAASPRYALAQASPPNAPVLSPEQAIRRDLDRLTSVLTGKSSTQAQRDEAARRLASRSSPESREILFRNLRDGGHDASLAIARAIADDPAPDARFIEPLAGLLGSERQLHEAAVHALARMGSNDAARNHLTDFARDTRQQVAPARVVAIRALGTVVDKSVAQTLLDLLTDERLGGALCRQQPRMLWRK